MAPKRKRATAVAGAGGAPSPTTRAKAALAAAASTPQKGGAAVDAPSKAAVAAALEPWLGSGPFEDRLVPQLYRLSEAGGPWGDTLPVVERGDAARGAAGAAPRGAGGGPDPVAAALGLPSPFVAACLADRKGIWQPEPPIAKQLGEDPSGQFRQVHAIGASPAEDAGRPATSRSAVAPAGLRNLGATCYLNSLLQYLFFNVEFRNHLLQATSGSEVVQALQRVFALLAAGRRAAVDPGEFVRVAGVDAVEQEDATEFSTLLLDWLERALGEGGASADGAAEPCAEAGKGGGGSFIPRLFQGEVCQLLTCLEHPGHVFERREAFFELRARLVLDSSAGAKAASPASRRAATNGAAPPAGAAAGPVDSLSIRTAAVTPAAVAAPPPPAATVVDAGATGSPAAPPAPAAPAPQTSSKNKAAGKRKEKAPPPPPVRLEEMLADTAFPDEMLDGSNKYDCPQCRKKVDARRSIRLARPPNYLHITVERYHYDLQKGERVKLNNPVSFPQTLRLRQCGQKAAPCAAMDTEEGAVGGHADDVVDYECMGYLEHVSDSAHSGHYTATLFQEDADAAEALALAADDASAEDAAAAPAEATEEPAAKRPRPGPEVAGAGEGASPGAARRRGLWWTLDDLTVSPVLWQPGKTDAYIAKPQVAPAAEGEAAAPAQPAAAAAGALAQPPQRIESSAVYLVLYRRRIARCAVGDGDVAVPGRPTCSRWLPPHLASWVAADNRALCDERRSFKARSSAVERFLSERRAVAQRLIDALRQREATPPGPGGELAVVPSAWLAGFLHGEDRTMADLLAGETRPAAVTYWRALSRRPASPAGRGDGASPAAGRRGGHQLDPLAVWCGEVKLLPMSVLDSLGGAGGLDSSLFISLSEAMGREVCEAAWRLHKLYQREWLQIRRILTEGKVSMAQARQLQSEGKGDEIVWVSMRVQRLWLKLLGGPAVGAAKSQQPQETPWEHLALRAFLREVQEARWGGRIASDDLPQAAQAEEAGEEGDGQRTPTPETPRGAEERRKVADVPSVAAPSPDRCEVNLTAGIVCHHGLVANTRSAFLARRADVGELLEISREKGQAFTELWPHVRAVPQIRAGGRRCRGGDGLLGFGATCAACRGEGAAAAAAVQSAAAVASQRVLIVKRRYASKVTRKVGQISLPESEEVTDCQLLSDLIKDQLKFPVSHIFVDIGGSEEVELKGSATLDAWEEAGEIAIKTIVVEKDESTPPAKEAAAFQGSIFRSGSASLQ